MPFCTKCGSQVDSSGKFCQNCGATVNIPITNTSNPALTEPAPATSAPIPQPALVTPAAPAYASADTEQVLGVIALTKPKSLGRCDRFTAVVTSRRFIVAQLTNKMVADAAMQARDEAKAEGKGFFGQWANQLKGSSSFTQKYLTMNPDAAIAETQGNFAIDHAAVNEVKLNLKNLGNEDEASQHEFELNIYSTQGQHQYRMAENNDYVNLLKQAYGEKVKTPKGYFSSHGFKFRIGF
jgi:hypothetical protein